MTASVRSGAGVSCFHRSRVSAAVCLGRGGGFWWGLTSSTILFSLFLQLLHCNLHDDTLYVMSRWGRPHHPASPIYGLQQSDRLRSEAKTCHSDGGVATVSRLPCHGRIVLVRLRDGNLN